MQALAVLARSRALWNRTALDLDSDEVLAQILDHGDLEAWRALFTLMSPAGAPARALRERAHALLRRVPVGRPYFWLAALSSLGEPMDWSLEPAGESAEANL